jgi:hypothetical protein
MEPLSHYHYEIYRCKPIPINLNHASTMHQSVPQPVINLYHKQVHQPCTNLYQTTCNQPVPYKCATNHVPSMCQSCVNYSSTMNHQYVPTSSTIHLMYVPTHQLLVSTMYPTCTSAKKPVYNMLLLQYTLPRL